MKAKEDIYKKPKTPISEYINVSVVSFLVLLFLGIEGYYFFTQEKTTTSITVTEEKNGTTQKVQEPSIPVVKTSEAKEIVVERKVAPKVVKNDADTVLEKLQTQTLQAAEVYELLQPMLVAKDKEPLFKLALELPSSYLDPKNQIVEHFITSKIRLKDEEKPLEIEKVEALIQKGYRLNLDYANGNELIRNRHYDMAKLLIEHSMLNVNMKNAYGYSLLHEAAAKGHTQLITLLLDKGADINVQANDGASLLHYPTNLGFRLTVELLLKRGINPNMKATLKYPGANWNAVTPLHIAAEKGNVAIVEKLIEFGADTTLTNGNGKTALDLAKEKNALEVVQLLEKSQTHKMNTRSELEEKSVNTSPKEAGVASKM